MLAELLQQSSDATPPNTETLLTMHTIDVDTLTLCNTKHQARHRSRCWTCLFFYCMSQCNRK